MEEGQTDSWQSQRLKKALCISIYVCGDCHQRVQTALKKGGRNRPKRKSIQRDHSWGAILLIHAGFPACERCPSLETDGDPFCLHGINQRGYIIREVNLWGARNANQKLSQTIISTELEVLEWPLPAVQPLQPDGAEWRSLTWLTQSTDSPSDCPAATVGLWCLLFADAGFVMTISQRNWCLHKQQPQGHGWSTATAARHVAHTSRHAALWPDGWKQLCQRCVASSSVIKIPSCF